MKATTIKLEGELLEELEASKPEGESLSAYVRTLLRRNLDQAKIRDAAVAYRAFVGSNEVERKWLDEWDRADLNRAPRDKKGRS